MSDVRQLLGGDGLPKFFFSQAKAEAYIAKKNAGDTHTWKDEGGRFILIPKGEAND